MHGHLFWGWHWRHILVPFDHLVCSHMHVSLLYTVYSESSRLRFGADTGCCNRCCSFLILFIELPLLLRICPTSQKFDSFVRRFETNYMRAAIYGIMSIIQWLSIIVKATSLIAAAVFLLLPTIFYLLAGVKGQGFVGSKTLGGQGVAQMIV